MFGVRAILEGGFRLVRQRFGAVAAWGLIYLVFSVGMFALLMPFYRAIAANPGAAPDPAMFGQIATGLGLIYVLLPLILVVLFAAAFRAVLQPERRAFAYLRVGMDELRLLGLALLVGVASFVAYLVSVFVIALLAGLATIAGGQGVGFAVGAVLFIVWLAAFFYVQVRLSLAGPLSIYRGRFVLGESWRLTRGHFWSIFLAYLLIGLIFFAVYLVVWTAMYAMIMSAPMGEALRNPQNPAAAQALMAQMVDRFTTINAASILAALMGAVAASLWVALNGGAAATAASLLADDGVRAAEVFE